jgi:hypothetical protein
VELREKKKSTKKVWPKRRNNRLVSEKITASSYFAIENLNDGYFIPGYNNYIKEPIGEPSVKDLPEYGQEALIATIQDEEEMVNALRQLKEAERHIGSSRID